MKWICDLCTLSLSLSFQLFTSLACNRVYVCLLYPFLSFLGFSTLGTTDMNCANDKVKNTARWTISMMSSTATSVRVRIRIRVRIRVQTAATQKSKWKISVQPEPATWRKGTDLKSVCVSNKFVKLNVCMFSCCCPSFKPVNSENKDKHTCTHTEIQSRHQIKSAKKSWECHDARWDCPGTDWTARSARDASSSSSS